MKKMRKMLTVLLTASMLSALLGGCGGKDSTTSGGGSEPAAEAPAADSSGEAAGDTAEAPAAEGSGGKARLLPELAAEVLHVPIPAGIGDLRHRLFGIGQLFPRHADAAGDHIVHTGDAKHFFV